MSDVISGAGMNYLNLLIGEKPLTPPQELMQDIKSHRAKIEKPAVFVKAAEFFSNKIKSSKSALLITIYTIALAIFGGLANAGQKGRDKHIAVLTRELNDKVKELPQAIAKRLQEVKEEISLNKRDLKIDLIKEDTKVFGEISAQNEELEEELLELLELSPLSVKVEALVQLIAERKAIQVEIASHA